MKSWLSMFVHPNILTASSLIVRHIDIANNFQRMILLPSIPRLSFWTVRFRLNPLDLISRE